MNQQSNPNQAFVDHWRRVGPQLEEIRRRELAAHGDAVNSRELDALFQLAIERGTPRTTSGLVELQRFFMQAFS
jgi:hypothetical protein